MARQLHLSAKITVCRYNELTDNEKILVDKALREVGDVDVEMVESPFDFHSDKTFWSMQM